MDIKSALKGQYHAGLAMLRIAIKRCPEDVWLGGTHPRTTWRVAYHAVFYTHLYMVQSEEQFVPWHKHVEDITDLWGPDVPVEQPYSKQDLLEYVDFVTSSVDATIDGLDLDSAETGYHWYKNMTKLEHQLLNLRHLNGHVGQISERLMEVGIDTDWVSRRKAHEPS